MILLNQIKSVLFLAFVVDLDRDELSTEIL